MVFHHFQSRGNHCHKFVSSYLNIMCNWLLAVFVLFFFLSGLAPHGLLLVSLVWPFFLSCVCVVCVFEIFKGERLLSSSKFLLTLIENIERSYCGLGVSLCMETGLSVVAKIGKRSTF